MTTTFTAAATGAPLPDVQWQVSTDNGANWNNLAEGGVYSGVTTTRPDDWSTASLKGRNAAGFSA